MGPLMISSFLLLLNLQGSWETSASQDYYIGAVVNYSPKNTAGVLSTLMGNVAAYSVYIAQASAENADIIVFPRNGLRGFTNIAVGLEIPDPENKTVPCQDTHSNKVLKYLSCASYSNAIYTVVSLDELVKYDTNKTKSCTSIVAFDRNGTLIARRRERKCRVEEGEDSFETDFGVRMGLMDDRELFDEDSLSSLKKSNVTHMAVPFDVVNRLPFNTGIQIQSYWAYQADVGLLAAGLDSRRRTGSGIYRGRDGPVAYTSAKNYKSGLVLQAIAKSDGGKAPTITQYWDVFSKDRVKRKSTASVYTSTDVDVKVSKRDTDEGHVLADRMNGYHRTAIEDMSKAKMDTDGTLVRTIKKNETICENSLCCTFQVTLTSRYVNEDEGKLSLVARADDFSMNQYYFVVFDGSEQFWDGVEKQTKRCAVVSGLSKSLLVVKDPKYGNIYQVDTTLEEITITTNATQNMGPNILVTGVNADFGGLVSTSEFNVTTTKDKITMFNSKPLNKVITFGLQSYSSSKALPDAKKGHDKS